MQFLRVVTAGLLTSAAALVAPRPRFGRCTAVRAAADDAIAAFAKCNEDTVAKISAALPIEAKADVSWLSGDGISIGGKAATVLAYDAPGPANVAWLASTHVQGTLSALTIFNGPLTDVPHLALRAAIVDGSIDLRVDWRPRAYGAYETAKADGEFPDPASREAFAHSGFRTKFAKAYFTDAVKERISAWAHKVDSPTPAPRDLEDASGPLKLALRLPLNDLNVAAVITAQQLAAEVWLEWALDSKHVLPPGMKVTSTYAYDTKLRARLYGSSLALYQGLFGTEDGAKLAAADAGPLDEGYVGGAS
ncbi:hypothetical protein M885DRAFT_515244 [Pelagophyceae sp. CCMP2097]|nr:hypothetical protein M885DRAFT_515244 [Pelagophyceae sp. CCMP2097]